MLRNYSITMVGICLVFFLSLCIPLYNNASEHVIVKLSAESKYSIITPKNGQRIHLFATELDIEPIMPNKPYSRHRVAFLHDEKIDQLAKQLDMNQDYIIDLGESFKLY